MKILDVFVVLANINVYNEYSIFVTKQIGITGSHTSMKLWQIRWESKVVIVNTKVTFLKVYI